MFRIKKYEYGWVVEIKRRKWWGKSYWTHFVGTSGMEDKPWQHSTYEYAMMSLLDKVKQNTQENS